ncbi:hypothetical protein evm_011668 [Chilo suppressalis]|nr:hypothetical protein evm_011668 [Chilo suppressalis]
MKIFIFLAHITLLHEPVSPNRWSSTTEWRLQGFRLGNTVVDGGPEAENWRVPLARGIPGGCHLPMGGLFSAWSP